MKSKAFDHSKYPNWIDPETVLPYERNAKQHTEKQIKNLVNSINRFGWQQDVVITSDNVLVIGHGRRLAALQIGCDMPYHVIDKTADELTDEDIRELRIVDNQTNAETGMDWDALEAELEDLSFDGFDFDFSEMFEDDTEENADEIAPAVGSDDAFEPDEPIEPKAKRGDIYQLGRHRLMCGDSTDGKEIDKLLNGAFVRMTVTSPPYGVGKDYEEKGIEAWRKTIGGVINAIKGKTLIVCWNIIDLFSTGTQFTEPTGAYSIHMFDEAGYGMLYNRIWKKPGANFAGNNPYYTVTTKPAQDYEYLYAFAEKDADKHLDGIKRYLFGEAQKAEIDNAVINSIGGPKFMCGHWFTNHQWSFIDQDNYVRLQAYCKSNNINAFDRDYCELKQEYLDNSIFSHTLSEKDFSEWGLYGVWEFNTVHERLGGHAAAYPVELPSRFIKMHSYEGNAVLDPFGGTGTTLIACEQLNRTCYMMEMEPKYCDVIIDRWEKLTGKKAVLLNS